MFAQMGGKSVKMRKLPPTGLDFGDVNNIDYELCWQLWSQLTMWVAFWQSLGHGRLLRLALGRLVHF